MKNMKEFLHNGQKVIYQEVRNESFLDLLNKSGITPEEVPDENLRYRVFKYINDGQERYACVLVANAPDEYIEKVYITFKFPEDSFNDLMMDVTGQLEGREPKKMKTRLEIALEQAEIKATKWIADKYPDKIGSEWFFGWPEEIEEEYRLTKKLALISSGYTLNILDKITVPGIDLDAIRELLK